MAPQRQPAMRLRQWHFPEMRKIVTENVSFVKVVTTTSTGTASSTPACSGLACSISKVGHLNSQTASASGNSSAQVASERWRQHLRVRPARREED